MTDPHSPSSKSNRCTIESGIKGDRTVADSRLRIVDRFAECDLTVVQVELVIRFRHDQRRRLASGGRRTLILVGADIDRAVHDA